MWNYYNPCDSEFAEVEALAPCEGHKDDSKKCTTKIKIGAKLSLPDFIKAAIDFLLEKNGDNKKTAASGYSSKLELNGEDSVGAAIGIDNSIKGKIGCWITLAEYKYDGKKQRYVPVCVKSAQVDGKKIKADTFYTLKNGKFVEAK